MVGGTRVYRKGEIGPRLSRAAQYLRMSTEHQRYSTENQKTAIAAYAARHGMILVQTYTDGGRSGLTLRGRPALQKLLDDVAGGSAGYDAVLVYDISRWGRFQDTDESAAYEFMCRRAGIQVIYCAEPFQAGDAPLLDVLKSVKRCMAGEFSRELGEKVYRGQRRIASMGYHQGGSAPYALRRARVDESRGVRAVMESGQSKVLSTDRVILIPGPVREQRVVRDIFRQFAELERSMPEIAADLNAKGIRSVSGGRWYRQSVRRILRNERYAGTCMWGQSSERLKTRRKRSDPTQWIRVEEAIAPIVPRELWSRVQRRLGRLAGGLPDEEVLAQLRELLRREGHLSSAMIDGDNGLPSSKLYQRRFGGLQRVYQAIGYVPRTKARWHASYSRNSSVRKRVLGELLGGLHARGASLETSGRLLRVDRKLCLAVVSACHQKARSGHSRWVIHRHGYGDADLFLVLRMAQNADQIMGYYLLPRASLSSQQTSLGTRRSACHEAYRAETLEVLFDLFDEAAASGTSVLCRLESWAARNQKTIAC